VTILTSQAEVFADKKAVTIQVSILGSNDSWSVRFPVNPASPTSSTCAAASKADCTLASSPPCTAFDSSAANPNYLSSFLGEGNCDTAVASFWISFQVHLSLHQDKMRLQVQSKAILIL